MRVALCIPTLRAPFPQTVEAADASLPLLRAAGHTPGAITEVGSAYISWARANMLGKALKWNADAIVFIDHDLSWRPGDLLKLIETPGDVVAGTYRFKDDTGDFMGQPLTRDQRPIGRADGCVAAHCVPAGFLKITPDAVADFREAYPELICDDKEHGRPFVDLFNHGAHNGVWYGEDYAFSRRWRAIGGQIWIVPDLAITHWTGEKGYPGNYHEYLMQRPGGALDPMRAAA